MGIGQTPEQVQDKYVAAMPAPIGEAFCDLYNSVCLLFSRWSTYRALFFDKDAVDLLNATAPVVFSDTQRVLFANIMLHLCRLTDPPQSAGKDNLSLRALVAMFTPSIDPAFRDSLTVAVDDAVAKTAFAREWRNKEIGHTALPVSAGGTAFVLPKAGKAELADAVASIGHAMNCVQSHYLNGEIYWEGAGDTAGGVLSLFHYLRKGLECQRQEEAARFKTT